MNIIVGVAEDVGVRQAMEDEHAVYRIDARSFLSGEVYDGHGDRRAAQAAAETLTPHFLDSWRTELKKTPMRRRREETLVREAYLSADRYISERAIRSGTAAATLYIIADRFIAANAGDSRAIMGTSDGAVMLTKDHKPELPEERHRIEEVGGRVIFLDLPRVQGILAMSRALGDPDLRPYVIPEPRVVKGQLGKENDYAVVASDGIWDVLSPEEALSLVREADNATKGAGAIRDTARLAGSKDNITVVVLDLRAHTSAIDRDKMSISRVIDYGLKASGDSSP